MSINEFHAKAKELRELRHMADELAAEIETLQDEIKSHMDAVGIDSAAGPGYKITWRSVTSSRFDTSAFKKDNPEIAAAYTKTTTTRRFMIS